VAVPPLETIMTTPKVSPSAAGMARGTAYRDARLLRRRGADRCSLSIFESTSMWKTSVTLSVHHRMTCTSGDIGEF
jgi:hypothetical protein